MSSNVNDNRNRPRKLPDETRQKIQDAQSLLSEEFPYWAIDLQAVPWYRAYPDEVTPDSPLGISESGIGIICPEYVADIPVKEFATDYLHAFTHILTETSERARGLGHPELEDIHRTAQDLALNSWIETGIAGSSLLKFPVKRYILPKDFKLPDHKSYEEYFGLLLKNPPPPPPQGNSGDDSDGNGGGKHGFGAGRCNCSGPGESPADKIAKQIQGAPDVPDNEKEDLGGRSPQDREDIGKNMQQRAAEAGNDAKQQPGKGSLQDILPVAKVEPTIDWKEYLRRIFVKAVRYVKGFDENDWKRPSRRSPQNIFIPTQRRRLPLIDGAMDTSGSMYGGPLAEACAEIWGIIQASGARMRVYYCDDDLTNIAEVNTWEALAENVKGGGGTGFSAVFDHIVKTPVDRRTKVLFFVTDGYVNRSDIPETCPPGLHVVWVITRNGQNPPCPWGDKVKIGDRYKASAGL